MTSSNQQNILEYISGNFTPTNPSDAELSLESMDVNRNDWLNYIPPIWNNFRFEGMVSGNELTNNLSVLYGGYLDGNNNCYGIIIT